MDDDKLIRKKGYVAGWGKTRNDDDNGSSKMRYLPVPMVPILQCQLMLQRTINKNQLCAGGIKGKDICLGDSGSPFTYFTNTKLDFGSRVPKLRHFQVGIVSYGINVCGAENVPVVYTRVRSYLTWILDNMKS
ncbi:unnamed protein product [Allacma fusca]|uniref:Peptidase S1 domain-containing protein n=1 Tax=Allacma fusca TaxID=39272 RepID=A0A8J2K8L8_9HEXA|nr:unnamed protein product [Allacma fusca]